MAEKLAVGVDFGGTKISAGVVDLSTGRLAGSSKKKTKQVYEEDDVVKRIISVVDESLEEADINGRKLEAIGIGAAGQVNRQKGILISAPNIGVKDLALSEPLSDHYQVPCHLGNDVEVATIAERNFGAGRDCDNFICIFVGTGIGSGIVQNGKLYRGANGTAGEIGHMLLIPDGKQCGCGAYGCLEAYASRTAVAKAILADLERGLSSDIEDKIDMSKGILRSKAIASAVDAGDKVVTANVIEAAKYFGMGLASVVNFYNPEKIIVGGGLVEALDIYLEVAMQECRRRALRVPSKKLQVIRASLGDAAGIIGAALLSRETNS